MITIDFTCSIFTPESTENGDSADNGFIDPRWDSMPAVGDLIRPDDYERKIWRAGELREAIEQARQLDIRADEGADWFYSIDTNENYQTGAEYTYALHIVGVTDATRKRIARLLQ